MIPVEHFYEVIWKRHLKKYNIDALTYLPYGSSNIFNLRSIHSTGISLAACLFNDQEPSMYSQWEYIINRLNLNKDDFWISLYKTLKDPEVSVLSQGIPTSLSGTTLYVYSDLNNPDLDMICKVGNMIPVYHWYHGYVARHWFNLYRFDPDNYYNDNITANRFLLYARAFTGTREYRLKLIEKLCLNGVYKNMLFNYHNTDGDTHYKDHIFVNKQYTCNTDLDLYLTSVAVTHPSESARIDLEDFRNSNISIVTETTFDKRIFLTEKTCKCFAAHHPFILLCGPGSLELLRKYGFKTFGEFWDESYDLEEDHYKRLVMITKVIEKLNKLSDNEFLDLMQKIKPIVEHNYRWFYSAEFEDILLNETEENFSIVNNIAAGVLGGTLFRVFKEHAIVSKTELVGDATPMITASLEYLKEHYPDSYNNVISAFKDTINTITSPNSKESSEEQ